MMIILSPSLPLYCFISGFPPPLYLASPRSLITLGTRAIQISYACNRPVRRPRSVFDEIPNVLYCLPPTTLPYSIFPFNIRVDCGTVVAQIRPILVLVAMSSFPDPRSSSPTYFDLRSSMFTRHTLLIALFSRRISVCHFGFGTSTTSLCGMISHLSHLISLSAHGRSRTGCATRV